MIKLDPLHPIQSAIMELLAQSPQQSMIEIIEHVTQKQNLKSSKSSLYRLINQLLDAQMIVKSSGLYSLNYMWAAHIQNLAEHIETHYFGENHLKEALTLKEGSARNFLASSFRELDPIWNHLLVAVKELYPDEPYWSYNSDTYHMYVLPETEKRLSQTCHERGGFYFLIGNDNFLNQKGEIMYQKTGAISLITENHPFLKDGYFLWVCGDHIIEVPLPRNLTRYLRLFFDSTKSMEDYDQGFLESLFDMKIKCKLILRRDKKEAEQLRKKLEHVFESSKTSLK